MAKITDPYLTIINTKNRYNPSNFKPFTYEKVKVIAGDWHKKTARLETNTKLAYDKVKQEFNQIGIDCWLMSGKRNYHDQFYAQGETFDKKLKDLAVEKIKAELAIENDEDIKPLQKIKAILKNPKHIKLAYEHQKKYAARIGFSEHHSGLAIDIKVDMTNAKIPPKIKERYPEANKGLLNFITRRMIMEKHGFIQTYPQSARIEKVTGMSAPEAWHWRYVGAEHSQRIAHLRELVGQDIFLEDYVKLLSFDVPSDLTGKQLLEHYAGLFKNKILKIENTNNQTL